ncbi:protocatechuate 3,4-dioxygenase subunit alpha [Nocardioides sp. LHG3406-4]|uniref:protocatechuate 3,4-dioxygenase subunit alpha n=1 Tax=Nocardioides sp. LHG3406-4 TaxID=2804575 RepID=UPI003CEA46FD
MGELSPTPGQTVGPFFHYALPFQGGASLVPPGSTGAIQLHGTVYDGAGDPVSDALLELRQADAFGRISSVEGSIGGRTAFTGWGRAATDAGGRYSFTTVEPGPTRPGAVPFFALTVFARGLLDRLFTRIYLPGPDLDQDPFLAALPEERRATLVATREPGDEGSPHGGHLRFDVHLQGDLETTFLTFPRHGEL